MGRKKRKTKKDKQTKKTNKPSRLRFKAECDFQVGTIIVYIKHTHTYISSYVLAVYAVKQPGDSLYHLYSRTQETKEIAARRNNE